MNDCRYEVVQAVSKNGKEYAQLCVAFSNGYVLKTFLNTEQLMCIRYAQMEDEKKGK